MQVGDLVALKGRIIGISCREQEQIFFHKIKPYKTEVTILLIDGEGNDGGYYDVNEAFVHDIEIMEEPTNDDVVI